LRFGYIVCKKFRGSYDPNRNHAKGELIKNQKNENKKVEVLSHAIHETILAQYLQILHILRFDVCATLDLDEKLEQSPARTISHNDQVQISICKLQ
jgi:hypothetical protein